MMIQASSTDTDGRLVNMWDSYFMFFFSISQIEFLQSRQSAPSKYAAD